MQQARVGCDCAPHLDRDLSQIPFLCELMSLGALIFLCPSHPQRDSWALRHEPRKAEVILLVVQEDMFGVGGRDSFSFAGPILGNLGLQNQKDIGPALCSQCVTRRRTPPNWGSLASSFCPTL